MTDLRIPLAVGIGGATGALARAGMAHAIPGGSWPWATWLTNLIGCFAIGVAVVWLVERPLAGGNASPPPVWLRPLLITGLLGGFTTFSTFADELRRMSLGGAAAYAMASLVLGVLSVAVGRAATRRLWNVGKPVTQDLAAQDLAAQDLAAEEDG